MTVESPLQVRDDVHRLTIDTFNRAETTVRQQTHDQTGVGCQHPIGRYFVDGLNELVFRQIGVQSQIVTECEERLAQRLHIDVRSVAILLSLCIINQRLNL